MPVRAQAPQAEAYCFAVADSGDNLVFINKDGDGFLNLGLTGTGAMEAIAFNPGVSSCGLVGSPRNIPGCLYATNTDDFGFLDYDDSFDGDGNDSEFIAVRADIGTCTLPGGASVAIDDVDGLQFDLTRTDATTGTFVLWATERDGDGAAPDDVLFQIDPTTGLVDTTPTPGFTGGATCVRISGAGIQVDIDDIAVDPTDGMLYAVNNVGGGTDQLVSVDPVTGAATIIGPFNFGGTNVNDMEGMSFGFDGQLYGTTGGGSTPASNDNTFWAIDAATGVTTSIAPFSSFDDYEAVACLTDNLLSGTVFFDVTGDGVFDPGAGDIGFLGARVLVYIDTNDDGAVDGGDTLICDNPGGGFPTACPVTDAAGFYQFVVGQGSFVIEVDTATLPAAHAFTTDNVEEADFATTDFGLTDPDNDFGFNIPGILSLDKTSDAGGLPVVQGQTITYSLIPRGAGSGALFNARVQDSIPAGTSFVGASPTQSGGPDPLVWKLGSTTPGVPGFAQGNVTCGEVVDLPADLDTYIEQDDTAANNGGADRLLTRPEAAHVNRAFYRFNLTALPAGATINSAEMLVTSRNNRSDHQAQVKRVTSNWNELANWTTTNGTTSWGTAGGDFDSTVLGTLIPNSTQQAVDLTGLVQDWVDGTLNNYGVVLDPTGTDNGDAEWAAREDGTASRRPFIRTAYEFLSAGGCPSTIQAPADQDTYIEQDDQAADNSGENTLLTRPQDPGEVNRALYRFDLSAVPADAIIDSALLTITSRNSRSNHLANVHQVTTGWAETANWNTPWASAGGDFDASVLGTFVPDSTQQQVDITALVQDWIDGVEPNYGVLLDPTGTDAGDAHCASTACFSIRRGPTPEMRNGRRARTAPSRGDRSSRSRTARRPSTGPCR